MASKEDTEKQLKNAEIFINGINEYVMEKLNKQ